MRKLVVLTGAGMSAESGLATFRDSGGLWEGHDVMEVASPEGWHRDKKLVLNFYNERRRQALNAQPNRGHELLAELEEHFEVSIVTQNVDDLHERAGSSQVIHLHGTLFESRSTKDEKLVYPEKGDINIGDICELGSQLRPNIVWFGEAVPMIEVAARETMMAEVLLVVGTSLAVYPAAGLINYANHDVPKYIVDPNLPETGFVPNLNPIALGASEGIKKVYDLLTES